MNSSITIIRKETLKRDTVTFEELNIRATLTKFIDTNAKFEFDYLIACLKQKQNSSEFLSNFLIQTKECIHLLEPNKFEPFVNCILNDIKWQYHSNNDRLLGLLNETLTDLVSAYTNYIFKSLNFVMKLFLVISDEINVINCENLYEFAHKVILNFVKISPLCKENIIKLMGSLSPYITKDRSIQAAYLRNSLKIADNLPDLRAKVLEISIQKLLKIDVNSPRDQILASELVDINETMDLENTDVQKVAKPCTMKHPFADKLDIMMVTIFEYINSKYDTEDPKKWEAFKTLYKEFLTIFEKYTLQTYGSSHTQFIMFYLCNFKPILAENFLDTLWKKFSNPNTCQIIRQTCAYYIGSFLCRANYIKFPTLIASLHLMINWAHNYIDKADASKLYPNINLHRTFYSLCQTIFYVFIFRHKELLSSEINIAKVKSWKLSNIVSSKLNPLKFCLTTITKKFASLTRLYQIVYCYNIIDSNNRQKLPVSDVGNKILIKRETIDALDDNGTNDNPLESFFPFDPYLLNESKVFIQKFYNEYVQDDLMDDDNDDQSSDDSDSSDDDSSEDEKMETNNPWSDEED